MFVNQLLHVEALWSWWDEAQMKGLYLSQAKQYGIMVSGKD